MRVVWRAVGSNVLSTVSRASLLVCGKSRSMVSGGMLMCYLPRASPRFGAGRLCLVHFVIFQFRCLVFLP